MRDRRSKDKDKNSDNDRGIVRRKENERKREKGKEIERERKNERRKDLEETIGISTATEIENKNVIRDRMNAMSLTEVAAEIAIVKKKQKNRKRNTKKIKNIEIDLMI